MPATVAQTKNLALISSVNGFGFYRYDSLDANSLVDIDGYRFVRAALQYVGESVSK